MKHIFSICIFFSLFMVSCIKQPDIAENTNKGNFEALWKIIDTRYCYLDYKHINWDSIHDVYEPQVTSLLSKYDFFDLMAKMLNELKDGHVNLVSNFDQSRYEKWFTDYPSNFNSDILYSARYLSDDYRIAGGMEYKIIDNGKIGYIYYEDFSNQFTDANISNIFRYFANCNGLIIDVRENGGGYLDLAEKLASYFFTQDTVTGYIEHKTGDGHSDFSAPIKIVTEANKDIQWKRPVIIIVNRKSFSATNSFICRMKMAPNATIIGDKSGGGGGLPLSSEIPNGWMVRFTSSPMFDANMNQIEWGIDPDVKVDMLQSDVDKGLDTIIEKAISLINKNLP